MFQNQFCQCTFSNIPNKQFNGKLNINKSGKGVIVVDTNVIIKELHWSSGNPIEYIYGKTSNGKLFTIIHPFNSNISLINQAEYSFVFNHIVLGKADANLKDMLVTKVKFKLDCIDFWCPSGDFQTPFDNSGVFSMNYKQPSSIHIFESKNCRLEVNYNLRRSFKVSPNEITFNEYKTISIVFPNLVTLTEAQKYIFQIASLFNLMTYKFEHPYEIEIADDKQSWIKLFNLNNQETQDSKGPDISPIKFEDFLVNSQSIIENWLDYFNDDEHLIEILLSFLSNGGNNQISTFLDLCKGWESFNAMYHNQPLRPKQAFEQLKEEIRNKLNDEEYEVVGNLLSYANNPSLANRLSHLFKLYSGTLFETLQLNEEKLERVKNTRNYYTHFSKSKKIIPRNEIYYYDVKLHYALLFMYFVSKGFEKDKIDLSMKTYFKSKLHFVE